MAEEDNPNLILIVNGGSSSVKFSLFSAEFSRENCLWTENCKINLLDRGEDETARLMEETLALSGLDCRRIKFTAHRVVHGGQDLKTSVFVDAYVEAQIDKLSQLAPVHNPIALKLIRAARKKLPESRHMAVFDTAFHSTLAEKHYIYPLPYSWYEELGIRRYGFHGINHQYCSLESQKICGAENTAKLVVCHLGNGASITAVLNGSSIDTSMGFTPLEGLMMGARSGSIDPGIIFYMLLQNKFSPEELDRKINNESGLLGISGVSKNMQEIEAAMQSGNLRARLAFDIFVERVKAGIAAMTASLGGIDALVFTGGIGEHSSLVRKEVALGLGYLGLSLDEEANQNCHSNAVLSSAQSKVKILRIEAREDIQMYRECGKLALKACS